MTSPVTTLRTLVYGTPCSALDPKDLEIMTESALADVCDDAVQFADHSKALADAESDRDYHESSANDLQDELDAVREWLRNNHLDIWQAYKASKVNRCGT